MRILLVDDHPLFLDGLTNLLSGRGLEVVGTARDGLEALDKARSLQPDVILMDIQMPVCDGLAATRLIHAILPEIKIVMLTMSSDDDDLFEAIQCGACGYLLKTQDTEEFFNSLLELAQGEAPLSPGLAARILHQFSLQQPGGQAGASAKNAPGKTGEILTDRELEVLTLVAQGLTYKEVGAKLFLTERTIKYHMGEIIARLHLENRAAVIEYARRSGLV
ncbi:MAG: response regulator transcription factor [Anaerolineales bacterium]|jgi:two-component system NarL family response regulator|nr:response regulator transcription factor [Anaerolineales bacterium]